MAAQSKDTRNSILQKELCSTKNQTKDHHNTKRRSAWGTIAGGYSQFLQSASWKIRRSTEYTGSKEIMATGGRTKTNDVGDRILPIWLGTVTEAYMKH